MLKKHHLPALVAAIFTLFLCAGANAADGGICDQPDANQGHDGGLPGDQAIEHPFGNGDVAHVAAGIGGHNVAQAPDGKYELTLSDGYVVDFVPQGNTMFLHTAPNGVPNLSVDANGFVHVHTADGYDMIVAPAPHDAAGNQAILAQNGLSNVTTTCGNRISATRQDGSIVDLEPDYGISHGQASGNGQYLENSTGADIVYPDGTRQHYHGVSPDLNQLRTAAQSLGGYSLTLNSDGSIDAIGNGSAYHVKLSPSLKPGALAQPGLRVQNGQVIMQYPDGLEQEVMVGQ